MRNLSTLVQRIRSSEARVCVVGQGYVGLTVAASAAVEGMQVTAIDVLADKVEALTMGRNVVPGVGDDLFRAGVETGRLHFATSFEAVVDADVVLLCVPTPLRDHRPDLSYVESATESVAERLSRGTLVVLESTTYAGTTESVVKPILESRGLLCGTDLALAYSPERVDPGNHRFGFRQTPRVVGGVDEISSQAATAFYGLLVDVVHQVSSPRAAELAKLLENTFRMVNIALVNELAVLCADQGISIWEVIGAAATKPFGFMPFYPGPGVGGHCIPLDPTYLSWQAYRDTGRRLHVVETAQEVNDHMPGYVAGRVADALNEHGRSVKGSLLLALGVTYKPDVGDVRESAAVEVLDRLARRGAQVAYHDPFVPELVRADFTASSVDLTDEAVATADCVLLLTPHSIFDIAALVRHSRLLFDARNAVGAQHGLDHVISL